MKKMKSILSVSAAVAAALASVPATAFAADDVLYGTMEIPYSDFYAAELRTPYEVDAVTSATASKWSANTEGGLVEGTYNNGDHQILGVVYPVAITQADLDALGADNYNFTALAETPSAYKTVTVSGSDVSFSAVQGAEDTFSSEITFTANSRYGDYQIDVASLPDTYLPAYGIVVETADGSSYAMRHLENIWRRGTSIAWSSGVTTTEGHGNALSYEDYADMMGKTVTALTYITADGKHTLNVNQYLPVKFQNTLTVENGTAGDGETAFTTEGFPSDYQASYAVGTGFTAENGTIRYTGAAPGTYTLTVTDNSGKYADVSSSFTLSTDEIPVKYQDGRLVAADGFTDEQAAAFIKAITKVNVDGTDYNTGRRGTTIVQTTDDAFGVINFDAAANDAAVFADGADGSYTITVTATAYNNPLVFNTAEVPAEDAEPDGEETDSAVADNTQSQSETAGTAESSTEPAESSSAAQTVPAAAAPKTGEAGVAVAAALLTLAAAAAISPNI